MVQENMGIDAVKTALQNERHFYLLIIDDHEVVSAGFAEILKSSFPQAKINTASTLSEGESLLRMMGQDETIIVLLDLLLDTGNGLMFLKSARDRRLKERLQTIVLSGVTSQKTVAECRRLGAVGYVPKTSSPSIVIDAILTVLMGKSFFVDGDESSDLSMSLRIGGLASGVQRVYAKILEGKNNKIIARETDLSFLTVKNYATQIYRVAGVSSRAELIAKNNLT